MPVACAIPRRRPRPDAAARAHPGQHDAGGHVEQGRPPPASASATRARHAAAAPPAHHAGPGTSDSRSGPACTSHPPATRHTVTASKRTLSKTQLTAMKSASAGVGTYSVRRPSGASTTTSTTAPKGTPTSARRPGGTRWSSQGQQSIQLKGHTLHGRQPPRRWRERSAPIEARLQVGRQTQPRTAGCTDGILPLGITAPTSPHVSEQITLLFEQLDFLYMPSRDVAADRTWLADVPGGHVRSAGGRTGHPA